MRMHDRRGRPDVSQRLAQMAKILREHPDETPDQLAVRMGVSKRSVYRYQQLIQSGMQSTQAAAELCPRPLLHLDAMNAVVAEGALLNRNRMHPDRHQALSALRGRTAADGSSGTMIAYERDPLQLTSNLYRHLERLRTAVHQRRKALVHWIDWNAASPPASVISPFHVGSDCGVWGVLAFDTRQGQHFHLPVDSITELSLLSERFRMPYRFNAAEMARRLPVNTSLLPYVDCCCTEQAASILSATLPDRLISLAGDPDGRFRCTVRAYDVDELTWWVLAWQGALQVITPARVRSAVCAAAAALTEAHR